MINNKINDQELSQMFMKIKNDGLRSICVQKNEIGEKTIQVIQENFLRCEGAKKLKKLVLKNPVNQNIIRLDTLFSEISWNADNLKNLSKLTVSQFYLNKSCLTHLSDVVQNLKTLYYLDISSNRVDLNIFLKSILKNNNLRYLNIAYNNGSNNNFCQTIADFLHYSNSLLHINLSGLNLKNIELVYKRGLKKARTLLSCHFGGISKQINI